MRFIGFSRFPFRLVTIPAVAVAAAAAVVYAETAGYPGRDPGTPPVPGAAATTEEPFPELPSSTAPTIFRVPDEEGLADAQRQLAVDDLAAASFGTAPLEYTVVVAAPWNEPWHPDGGISSLNYMRVAAGAPPYRVVDIPPRVR